MELEDRVKDLERRMNAAEDMLADADRLLKLRSAEGLPIEAATSIRKRDPKK